jgi:hypothetical protein
MATQPSTKAAQAETDLSDSERKRRREREFRAVIDSAAALDVELVNAYAFGDGDFYEKARAAIDHQAECEGKADEVIEMCGGTTFELAKLREWVRENGELSPWVLFNVVDKVRTLTLSESQRDRARRRNAASRAWVEDQWKSRQDQNQSKAAFSRVYATLIKKQFPKADPITSRTIETRWLKGL